MKKRLVISILASALCAFPGKAGMEDGTEVKLVFASAGNNVRSFLEVLASAEAETGGIPIGARVDGIAGCSAGGWASVLLTTPRTAGSLPMPASEALTFFATHGPAFSNTVMASLFQPNKSIAQTASRGIIAKALGPQGDTRVSDIPGKAEVILDEVISDAQHERSFSSAAVRSGVMPNVTLTELFAATASVERIFGRTPLVGTAVEEKKADGAPESKLPSTPTTGQVRYFVDSGSHGHIDPTPGIVARAVAAGKPTLVFAFEGGFGFESQTLLLAEQTRTADIMVGTGISREDVARTYGPVRVYLFHSTGSAYQACASCRNDTGSTSLCADHPGNMTRLIGSMMPMARPMSFLAGMEPRLLALNLLNWRSDADTNRALKEVAAAQMIGGAGARTPSYTKLVEVLRKLPEASTPSSAPTTWECKTCTFLNDSRKTSCEICATPGPTTGSSSSSSSSSSPSSSSSSSSSSTWACGACTFENPSSRTACEICATPKP